MAQMAQPPNRSTGEFNHPAMNYSKPPQLRRFQTGLVLLVSVVLGVGLWTGGWFIAQAMVNSAITDWMDAQRANGATVGYESLDLSGYPARITLDIKAPHYKGMVGSEPIEWLGERLTVTARPWNPWTLNIQAPGVHELTLAKRALAFKGQVDRLNIDVTPGDLWPENLDIVMAGVNLQDLQAKILTLHMAHDVDLNSLQVSLKGEAIQLPKITNLPLGNVIENLNLAFKMDDPFSSDQLHEDLGDAVTAWQSRDNQINIQRFKLRNGPLGITTSGRVSLDDKLQPKAAFTAKIEGLFQVLEILRLQGLIKPSNAVIATMALSAFSKRPVGGGPSSINLSVTVEDSTLKLGPISILDFPHLTWGIVEPEPVAEEAVPPRDYKNTPPIF